MFLSCVLGDQSKVSNEWKIIEDDYGNKFIANDSLRQRIRLGKNVADKLEKTYSSANTTGYEVVAGYKIAENITLSNNNKNMNLSLLNFWSKDKGEKKNHVDKHLAFITLVSKNYQLLDYTLMCGRIAQTYRKFDKTDDSSIQGCAIEFEKLGGTILTMLAWDKAANRYVEITVSTDDEGKLQISKNYDLTPDVMKSLKTVRKGLDRKMKHFFVTFPEGYLPTATYIVNGSVDGLIEKVNELTKDIKNAQIIVLPNGDDTFKDENKEELEAIDNMFNECLTENRVKAVTLVDVKVPAEYFKKHKVLYQFKLNKEMTAVECTRSN